MHHVMLTHKHTGNVEESKANIVSEKVETKAVGIDGEKNLVIKININLNK